MTLREQAEQFGRHCADYHEGQWSERYSILSTSSYKPGLYIEGPDSESAKILYDLLAQAAKEETK
jgi:hypothetical protein